MNCCVIEKGFPATYKKIGKLDSHEQENLKK